MLFPHLPKCFEVFIKKKLKISTSPIPDWYYVFHCSMGVPLVHQKWSIYVITDFSWKLEKLPYYRTLCVQSLNFKHRKIINKCVLSVVFWSTYSSHIKILIFLYDPWPQLWLILRSSCCFPYWGPGLKFRKLWYLHDFLQHWRKSHISHHAVEHLPNKLLERCNRIVLCYGTILHGKSDQYQHLFYVKIV